MKCPKNLFIPLYVLYPQKPFQSTVLIGLYDVEKKTLSRLNVSYQSLLTNVVIKASFAPGRKLKKPVGYKTHKV